MPPVRVAVIGAGAFGRNHLRVYRELQLAHPELVELVAFVEPHAERREALATEFQVPSFATLDELLAALKEAASALKGTGFSPSITAPDRRGALAPEGITRIDAASVCVPTVHHAAVAETLLRAGIDVLIEKPFAATLGEATQLLALAQQLHRIVAVGHLERFNPAVTAAIAALNKPMFFEAHRLSIFTPRSLDVDVVLDLMIHDLDIVLTLANSPVREVRAVGLPVLSRKTDIANVRLEFESGCVANFTASRVSTEQVRKLRFFQTHQYLSLDFARQELLTISVDPTAIAAALDPSKAISPRSEAAAALKGTAEVLKGTGFSPSIPAASIDGALAPEGRGDTRAPQDVSLGSHRPEEKAGAPAPEGRGDARVPQGFSLGSHRPEEKAGAPAPEGRGDARVPQGFSLGSHRPEEKAGASAPEGRDDARVLQDVSLGSHRPEEKAGAPAPEGRGDARVPQDVSLASHRPEEKAGASAPEGRGDARVPQGFSLGSHRTEEKKWGFSPGGSATPHARPHPHQIRHPPRRTPPPRTPRLPPLRPRPHTTTRPRRSRSRCSLPRSRNQ